MDAELKNFLEGMESRLREHSDSSLRALELRVREHTDTVANQLEAHLREHTENVETRLLSEFWKWARSAEINPARTAKTS